jgi:hypothetical protein
MEMIQSRVDIRAIIKNSGQMDVIKNVFLKDYQIKLIPHLNHDETEESEKAKDMTNQEAIDTLIRRHQSGNIPEAEKTIDKFIMQHLDLKFYNKHKPSDVTYDIKQFTGVPKNRNVGGKGESFGEPNTFFKPSNGFKPHPVPTPMQPHVDQDRK